MQRLFTCLLLSIFLINCCYAQKETKIDVQHNEGTVIGNQYKKIIYTTINKSNEDKVLLLDKYIDTNRKITLNAGGGITEGTAREIFEHAPPFDLFGHVPITLKRKKKHIVLNCLFYGVDGKVAAKLEDNKLVQPGNAYQEEVTEYSLMVVNDYNIPVLLVQLNKKKNSIDIYGVTFDEDGSACLIMTPDSGLSSYAWGQPYLLMKKERQDSLWFYLKGLIKTKLRQLHQE